MRDLENWIMKDNATGCQNWNEFIKNVKTWITGWNQVCEKIIYLNHNSHVIGKMWKLAKNHNYNNSTAS